MVRLDMGEKYNTSKESNDREAMHKTNQRLWVTSTPSNESAFLLRNEVTEENKRVELGVKEKWEWK